MRDIRDQHKGLFQLLTTVDQICEANNIKYSLFAGTLIGAIRHNGFIPWDDDADIVFERTEFEKFVEAIPSGYEIVRSPWVPRFKKLNSDVSIDVFVFDHAFDRLIKQKLLVLKLKFVQGMLKERLSIKKGNIAEKVLSVLTYLAGLLFSHGTKLRLYDSIAQQNNINGSLLIFSSLDQFKYIGIVLPANVISEYTKAEFEGTSLKIMKGYHEYLTTFYGNYMRLPDEHLRIPQHGNAVIES